MIIIAPFAKKLSTGVNPKDYPHWDKVIDLLKDYDLVQVGTASEQQLVEDFRPDLPLDQLADLVRQCTTWISVDSFFQHFCWDLGKKGVVIWGPSDPIIFGHPENVNLLKDRSVLYPDQFLTWEQIPVRRDIFVEPEVVVSAVLAVNNSIE
jgi:ADP-heptose:LPS heptosyltransferase